MKLKLFIALLASVAIPAEAAITITFSNGTNGVLGNFLSGSGTSVDAANVSNRLIWGIVVDTAGNGFGAAATGYKGGFSLGPNQNGFALTDGLNVTSDDVLYIATAPMASGNAINSPAAGEHPANTNRILSFTGFNFNAGLGVATGKNYAIIWFDTTSGAGTAPDGMKYGLFVPPSTVVGGDPVNKLPTDNGGSYTWAPAFVGPDAAKAMQYTLVPEASTLLLGALGVVGLLRRRR